MPFDDQGPSENAPLLETTFPQRCHSPVPEVPAKANCRICLEEDRVENLEQPCACSGTASYAHHDCVQQWIMAKGNKTCEICKHEYTGDFEVPPPPPPQPQHDAAEALRLLGPVRTIVINADGMIRTITDIPRVEDEDDDVTDDERRRAGVAWCLTFIMFTTLMLLLHKSMVGPSDDVQPVPSSDPSSPQDPDDIGFPLFIFWVLTRALLIGLPLYMVMRAAQEARRAALQAHFRMLHDSGASWGLVFPSMQGQAELVQIQRDNVEPHRLRGPDNV